MTTLAQTQEHEYAPPGYTPTRRHTARSQEEGVAMWLRKEWPSNPASHHNAGHIVGGPNYQCYQHEDGSGEVRHYSTTEIIRTRHDVVIVNSQCWGAGFAHCSGTPTEIEFPNGRKKRVKSYHLPLTLLQTILGGSRFDTRIYDIKKVVVEIEPFDESDASPFQGESEEEFKARQAKYRRNHEERQQLRPSQAIVILGDGTKIYVGRDEGIPFGFILTPEEAARIKKPSQAILLLKPDVVANAEAEGRRVRRQGEWWFVEMPEDFEPRFRHEGGTALLGNHMATYYGYDASPVEIVTSLLSIAKTEIDKHNADKWEKWRAWHHGLLERGERAIEEIATNAERLRRERKSERMYPDYDMKKSYRYEKLKEAVAKFRDHVEIADAWLKGYVLTNRMEAEGLYDIRFDNILDIARTRDFMGWSGVPFVTLKDIHEVSGGVYVKGAVRHANPREHRPVRLTEDGSKSIAFDNTRWWLAVQHWRENVISGGDRNRRAGRD